jgi:Holliday junction resolvasome RuvABC endonuclease subunit
MLVLGIAIRIESGSAVVGVALLDDDQVERELSLASPGDVDESHQLAELHGRIHDLLTETRPDELAIYSSGAMSRTAATLQQQRTLGAILAAAGKAGTRVTTWSRQKMGMVAGLGGQAQAEVAVTTLCADLSQCPAAVETRRAAAAARTAIVSS